MSVGPVEAETAAPVVDNKSGPITEIELVEETVEVFAMLNEPITVGAGVIEGLGVAHSDQVGSDAPSHIRKVGDDVAPQERRGGVAVKKHNRVTRAGVYICHLLAEYRYEFLLHGFSL